MRRRDGIRCTFLTVGQYLRPSRDHVPLQRYYTPAEFEDIKAFALALGYRHVESGPLVRSSYHADEHVKQERAGIGPLAAAGA